LIFHQVSVNGSPPLWFALDTGASFPFVIDTRRAKALAIQVQSKVKSEGGAGQGSFDIGFAEDVSLNLSGIAFPNQRVAVIDPHDLESVIGRPLDGLIGRPLLNRFVVEIDYFANRTRLYDPATYTYSGSGESLPLELDGDHVFVAVKITMPGGDPTEGRFLVDTGGAMTTALMTKRFAESHKLLEHAGKTITDRSLPALGGDLDLLVTRGKALQLGHIVIQDPIITLSQHSAGALAGGFDGVIGGELLRRFKVIFDSARRRLILEPNAHLGEACEYNMSGMMLRAEGKDLKSLRVHRIIKDSPAEKAGLQEGDRLVRIKDAKQFTMDEIDEMSKKAGRNILLRIVRGSKELEFNVPMRRLI